MVSNLKCEEEFVVDMPVSADSPVRIVRRVTDGQLYLVRDQSTAMAHDEIIAFETAARVLNHENLISVVKPNVAPANGSTDSDFSLVYEYCADGNLKQLFDKPHVEATHQGFLPEGLIWHVALSMLRALIFLHEGRRERVIMCKEDDKLVREWYCLDNDWMPILHRAIRPENIHFQAARGEETYGLCKLGNFGRCVVAGTARVEKEDNHLEVVAVLNDLVDRDVPQEQIRGMWELARDNAGTANRENMRHSGRLYTIGSELADLGAVLYHMMTGKRIEVDLCTCGCVQVDTERPGRLCSCSFREVEKGKFLTDSKYTDGLREAVIDLIRLKGDNSARAYDCFESGWAAYRRWKLSFDGQAYSDHYDDLVARKMAKRLRKLNERKGEMAVDASAEWE